MERAAPRILRTFALCLVGWTVIGALFLSQDAVRRAYFGDPSPWDEVSYWFVRVLMCAVLTPPILWLGNKRPIERRVWRSRVALHLLVSACVAPVAVALETIVLVQWSTLSALSLQNDFSQAFPVLLIFGFHAFVIVYWLVLGAQSGLRYYHKYQEGAQRALRLELRESELKGQMVDAQLSALKMQLQPHFLFNTLNAIVVLVRQQKGLQAEEILGRFSDLLRCVLADIDKQEVPLRRELDHLQQYLAIEQVRFSDRLRVALRVESAELDAAVPHMSLQPLVENAVRHGIGRSTDGGTIEIHAARMNDMLVIRIADDGRTTSDTQPPPIGLGMGLSNTRARLKQLYGESAKLEMTQAQHGGTVVTMELPYRMCEDDA